MIIRFVLCFILLVFNNSHAKSIEGKSLFLVKCASCHNQNPSKPGTIGPDIADSTLELITLKTQERKYPKNYKPKRKTRIMPKIVLNSNQLLKLYEYISSFNTKRSK